MPGPLTGKTAFVTGASSGIGAATASLSPMPGAPWRSPPAGSIGSPIGEGGPRPRRGRSPSSSTSPTRPAAARSVRRPRPRRARHRGQQRRSHAARQDRGRRHRGLAPDGPHQRARPDVHDPRRTAAPAAEQGRPRPASSRRRASGAPGLRRVQRQQVGRERVQRVVAAGGDRARRPGRRSSSRAWSRPSCATTSPSTAGRPVSTRAPPRCARCRPSDIAAAILYAVTAPPITWPSTRSSSAPPTRSSRIGAARTRAPPVRGKPRGLLDPESAPVLTPSCAPEPADPGPAVGGFDS